MSAIDDAGIGTEFESDRRMKQSTDERCYLELAGQLAHDPEICSASHTSEGLFQDTVDLGRQTYSWVAYSPFFEEIARHPDCAR